MYGVMMAISMLCSAWWIIYLLDGELDHNEILASWTLAVMIAILWPFTIWFQVPITIIRTIKWTFKK